MVDVAGETGDHEAVTKIAPLYCEVSYVFFNLFVQENIPEHAIRLSSLIKIAPVDFKELKLIFNWNIDGQILYLLNSPLITVEVLIVGATKSQILHIIR